MPRKLGLAAAAAVGLLAPAPRERHGDHLIDAVGLLADRFDTRHRPAPKAKTPRRVIEQRQAKAEAKRARRAARNLDWRAFA